jgi:hypothetical protein
MPIATRPTDTFTRGNLLFGFPVVQFTPKNAAGVFLAPVDIGIIRSAALTKEITRLALERGDSGPLVIDRQIVSRLEPAFEIETANFRSDIMQLLLGSSTLTPVTANAAAAVADDRITLLATFTFDTFMGLTYGSLNEASVAVEFSTITSEAVGTGNGVLGGTQGDFALDQKIKAIGDVTSFLVNGVNETANLVAGSTPAAGQIAIEVGEQDSLVTGSGAITFGASKIPGNGHAIVATYKPSFTTGAGDIVAITDFLVDPVLGRVRFLHAAADASPFRLAASAGGTVLLVDYTYNRKAGNDIKPFTQSSGFEGRCSIRQLTDIGINFDWQVPSATLQLTDDDLTFGAEDFANGSLRLVLNDAGGTDRFGTLRVSSEAEAGA